MVRTNDTVVFISRFTRSFMSGCREGLCAVSGKRFLYFDLLAETPTASTSVITYLRHTSTSRVCKIPGVMPHVGIFLPIQDGLEELMQEGYKAEIVWQRSTTHDDTVVKYEALCTIRARILIYLISYLSKGSNQVWLKKDWSRAPSAPYSLQEPSYERASTMVKQVQHRRICVCVPIKRQALINRMYIEMHGLLKKVHHTHPDNTVSVW
jgi:hypothetical protein